MMSAGDVGAQSGGIRVKRETIIIMSDRNDDLGVRDGSPSVTIKSGEADTQVQQYCRPKTFRKLSSASSILSEIFRHPDTSEDLLRRKIKRANDRDTSRELIEFLRNTSPPPQHNMSVSERHEGPPKKKRNRMGFFWRFWGRKGGGGQGDTRCEPPLILLPDSAVAGRTTGGYRHIAISIPKEHAHLDGIVAPTPRKGVETGTEAQSEPARPASDRIMGSALKPVAEKREPMEDHMPSTMLPLIPPLSNETFRSLLSADETLESISSYSSAQRESEFAIPEAEDASVGLQSPSVAPSRPLTAQPKGSVSSLISLTDDPPKLHHLRQRISNHRRSPVPGQCSIAASIYTNGTDPVVSDATARGYASPRLVAVDSPRHSSSSGTDDDSIVSLKEFDLSSSAEDIRDTGEQHTLKRRSHLDFKPHTRMGYPIPDFLAPRRSRLSLSPSNEYVHDTHALDAFLSRPEMTCPLCLTPVMVVAECAPSLSRQPSPELQQGFVTAQQSIASIGSFTSLDAPSTSTVDLTPCAASTPKLHASRPQPSPQLDTTPLFNLYPSIERLARRRPSYFARSQDPKSNPDFRPHRRLQQQKSLCHCRRLSRSDSHRELLRRYEELDARRDHELDIILNRLERLESNNDRWLQAMVPIFENLARGLLATQGGYEDSSGGGIWRRAEDRGQEREVEGGVERAEDRERVTFAREEYARQGSGKFLEEDDEYDSFWDLKSEVARAGHGMGVAVDRLPSRRGGLGQERGVDASCLNRQDIERWYGGSEGTLMDVSGLETVEPVMRELLSQSEDEAGGEEESSFGGVSGERVDLEGDVGEETESECEMF